MARASWIALVDTAIAGWEARAPADELALARALILAGERHEVFRVATIPEGGGAPKPFDYLEHLEARAPLFALTPEEAPPGRRFVTPGRVCWQEPDGTLVSDEIAELGALLRRLRPDAVDWAEPFMGYGPPVVVWATRGAIRIDVETDLWFPRILGVLDGNAPPPPTPPQRDNTILANCHTPRLNAFLADVRKEALVLGGTWRLQATEGIGTRYAPMTDERGITLP